MGMDVIGMNPTAEVGQCFQRNHDSWGPLAAFCTCSEYGGAVLDDAPDEEWKEWSFNDGAGLDGEQSLRLAKRLRELVADGTVARLVEKYKDKRDIVRWYRDDPAGEWKEEWATVGLRMDESDVAEFADFLEACGGFEIW